MKLHELGAQRPTEQAAQVLESQAGRSIDFSVIGPRRAQGMLQRVQGLLKEHRSRPDFHSSEQDPGYLQLVIMEQGLSARVSEQTITPAGTTGTTGAAGAAQRDPKAQMVMDKVKRGQTLTPDEQQTVNRIALTREGKKNRAMVSESEVQQAQVVLAAQDMIDRIQGMLEDISEMQFKDLPALANSIKNDMGTEQATQFQSAASAALTQLLTAVQAGKTELEGAQGVLTGQAPTVPGADDMAGGLGAAPDAGADLGGAEGDTDLSLDANLDIEGDEDEEMGAALGRERR
jgi:hypothetical protein